MSSAQIWALTHTGLVRRRNEDYFGATGLLPGNIEGECQTTGRTRIPVLAAVADGMGGHPCGDIASRLAIESLLAAEPSDTATLIEAVCVAENAIFSAMRELPDSFGMGATLSAVLLSHGSLIVANVGDSPVYEIVEGRLTRLSIDDNPLSVSIQGLPSSILTQCLGGDSKIRGNDVHIYEDQEAGQRDFLICSDGLSSFVDRASIIAAIDIQRPEESLETLLARALEVGAPDNVTIMWVRSYIS